MTTGKNKDNFEKWYDKIYSIPLYTDPNGEKDFYCLPFEMQLGVYLAYYDSIGIKCFCYWSLANNKFSSELWKQNSLLELSFFDLRSEAYKEAFKKADELINQKN